VSVEFQPIDLDSLELRISATQRELALARRRGDTLAVSIIEDALNDLLDSHPKCNSCNE
jgi:hypothetical protein